MMRRALIAAAALLALLGGTTSTASAATCTGNACVTGSGSGTGGAQVAPTAQDIADLGTGAVCYNNYYWRNRTNVFGTEILRITNHTHWCYGRSGKVGDVWGYTSVKTGIAWGVSNITWTHGWSIQPYVGHSVSKAYFKLEEGGYVVQTWSPVVCFEFRAGHPHTNWC